MKIVNLLFLILATGYFFSSFTTFSVFDYSSNILSAAVRRADYQQPALSRLNQRVVNLISLVNVTFPYIIINLTFLSALLGFMKLPAISNAHLPLCNYNSM